MLEVVLRLKIRVESIGIKAHGGNHSIMPVMGEIKVFFRVSVQFGTILVQFICNSMNVLICVFHPSNWIDSRLLPF